MLVFISEDFPVGLKQNLWEDDNLPTRGKLPIPNVSFVQRFYLSALSEKEDNYYEENMSRLLSDTDSHTIIGGRR